MNPFSHTGLSISDSLKSVRKSVLIYETIIELYFEDNDVDGIMKKLESGGYVVDYVTALMELEGGQKLVRFYDPSGNLIEVRTPVKYN